MSSWFTSIADTVAKSITDTATNVGQHIGDTNIKQAGDIFNALTLNTPEMTAEREDFRKDELRKTAVKDALSKILPWDTQYEERQILVDECHEAILSLSKMDSTFLGHDYNNISQQQATTNNNNNDKTNAEATDVDPASSANVAESLYSDGNPKFIGESHSTYVALCRAIATTKGTRTPTTPSSSSSSSGIPPLLEHFDLDAHVGLVEVMLKEDPRLVEKHANLCNIMVSEINFWKNYFYNIALVRLDVGLNIDEIWGTELPTTDEEMNAAIEAAKAKQQHQAAASASSAVVNVASRAGNAGASLLTSLVGGPGAVGSDNGNLHEQDHEEEITFDNGSISEQKHSNAVSPLVTSELGGVTSSTNAASELTTPQNRKPGSFSLPPLLSSSAHKKQSDSNSGSTTTPAGKSFGPSSVNNNTPTGADFEMISPPKMGVDDNNNKSNSSNVDDFLDDDNVVVDGLGGDDDDDDLDAEIARELEGL